MKVAIAFLLGVLTVIYAQDTTDEPTTTLVESTLEETESESVDSDSIEEIKFNSASHEGLSLGVFFNVGESDSPQISITVDQSDKIYCLTFERIFEATFTDLETCLNEDCVYVEVADSEVLLGDAADCTVAQDAANPDSFDIICANVRGATVTLAFEYNADPLEPGVEYIITIENYVFVDSTAKLVLEQSLEDCSVDRDSGDDDDDDDDDEQNTRRLEEDGDDDDDSADDDDDGSDDDDSNSNDESDGVSSDDSGEIDVGEVTFRLGDDALGHCVTDAGTTTDVNVKVVWQSANNEAQLLVDPFDCDYFELDPILGIDLKRFTGGANGVQTVISLMLASFIAVFWV